MIKSLLERLKFRRHEAKMAEHNFAIYCHRMTLAEKDLAFYRTHKDTVQRSVERERELLGDTWLTLINSGLSHRRVLELVRANP